MRTQRSLIIAPPGKAWFDKPGLRGHLVFG
jgi:hypothetical protein